MEWTGFVRTQDRDIKLFDRINMINMINRV